MSRIIIAGAGIGGLTAAIALARAGASVTLLERAPKLEETGAGIQLSPNATRILARLQLLDGVSAKAFRPEAIRVRSARSGGLLAHMSLKDAESRWGAPYLIIRRADLQHVLHQAAVAEPAISLHLNAMVAGFGTTATGVTATVKHNGISRVVEGDALIGADGIRSMVRARLVDGDDKPLETGRTAWRALVQADTIDPTFRLPQTGLWLGRDAHLVHYPVDGGRLVNVVAITREPASSQTDLWSAPGDPQIIRTRFDRWHANPRGLIGAASAWTTWPLFDRAPLSVWHAGRIALLGDAAHPILPFLAQGSAQAIEDAAALAEAYAGTRNIPNALTQYSGMRQDRASRVQVTSRQLGQIYHMSGPSALARDAGMRILGGTRLLNRYDWLYEFDSSKRDIADRDSLRSAP